jgi:hypothetical protein
VPIRPIRPPWPLCSTLLLISCASAAPPPPEVRTVAIAPPAPLLVAPARPALPVPGVALTQGRVAELLLEYDAALTTAIEQLGAVARLYATPDSAPGPSSE